MLKYQAPRYKVQLSWEPDAQNLCTPALKQFCAPSYQNYRYIAWNVKVKSVHMEVSGQLPTSSALPPREMVPVTLVQKTIELVQIFCRREQFHVCDGNPSTITQLSRPYSRHYTNYAIAQDPGLENAFRLFMCECVIDFFIFRRVHKIAKGERLLALSCLSICPHGTTWLPLDGLHEI